MPSLVSKNFLSVAFFFILITVSCSKKTASRIPRSTNGVSITSDISYGSNLTWQGKTESLKLDIYTPDNASSVNKYPLLVLAHGGSFLTGGKENLADLCNAFASKGMIVVSVDYRLGWNVSITACQSDTVSVNEAAYRAMQDMNAALRFLTANTDKYFINTDWIFTGGASAGAVMALNSAYSSDDYINSRYKSTANKLGELHNADNSFTNTYTIKGICSMWGGIVDPSIITAANGIPTIAYHGSDDQTIPVYTGTYAQCPNYQTLYGSAFICNKLISFGVPAVAHIYQGEGHGPAEYANNPDFISATAFCFFQSLMHGSTQSGLYKNMQSNCQ